ncbi:MAG: cation diffusion facilitator family transporter [Desulfatibacillaceae bacterium]
MEEKCEEHDLLGDEPPGTPDDGSPASDPDISRARRRALASIGVNLALALAKGVAGVISGSAALLGDAVHSATDVVGAGAAYLGLWLAGRRHPSFPYGMYKAENIAQLVTSVAILLAGYEIARTAILEKSHLPSTEIALPVTLGALLATFGFGLYQIRQGRRLSSPALSADGRDYLVDSISTLVVLASLVGAYFHVELDKYAAVVVAGFIFWSGGGLMVHAMRDLMDQSIDRETERDIIRRVEDHRRVQGVERFFSRRAGGRFLVDMDVVVRTGSHELAERAARHLEWEIREEFPHLVMVRIKTRPHSNEYLRRLTPREYPDGPVHPHLGKAPWFLLEVIRREDGEVVERQHMENPHAEAEAKRGLLTGRWMLEQNPDEVVVTGTGDGTAAALLEEAGVELVRKEGGESDE